MSTVNARVKLVDGLQFVGESESGHAVVMDGAPKFGGRDTGPRPTELLLIALGGCTGMDAISILRKKKQHVASFEMDIRGTRAEGHPGRLTDVEIEYVVRGRGVDEDAVKRAVELSMEKYCSVKFTLEERTKIGFTYRVEED
jgi:putative redox protein